MHALLVSNPTASTVTDARLRVVVRALEASFELEVVSTRERGHASALASGAVAGGAKAVIAFGGDGTVHEVVNGLLAGADSTDVILAPLPGGGTNVLARNLGYPTDLVEAAGHLIGLAEQRRLRRVGAGRLEATIQGGETISRAFVLGCGLCFDADTVRRVEESGLRPRLGDLAFVYCGARAFFGLRSGPGPPLQVSAGASQVAAWWASVACDDPYTYWGRRALRVAPHASIDGGLDLVAGRSIGFFRTLRWLRSSLADGRHTADPMCLELSDQDRVDVRADRPVPLQADGEYLGTATRLHARRLHAALCVMA